MHMQLKLSQVAAATALVGGLGFGGASLVAAQDDGTDPTTTVDENPTDTTDGTGESPTTDGSEDTPATNDGSTDTRPDDAEGCHDGSSGRGPGGGGAPGGEAPTDDSTGSTDSGQPTAPSDSVPESLTP
jgi:hypothetical protein